MRPGLGGGTERTALAAGVARVVWHVFGQKGLQPTRRPALVLPTPNRGNLVITRPIRTVTFGHPRPIQLHPHGGRSVSWISSSWPGCCPADVTVGRGHLIRPVLARFSPPAGPAPASSSPRQAATRGWAVAIGPIRRRGDVATRAEHVPHHVSNGLVAMQRELPIKESGTSGPAPCRV